MLKKKVEKALIDQIKLEEQSSRIYMAMASWCEVNGYPGAARFLYLHSEEERMHMTKLIKYVNDKGGHAALLAQAAPAVSFKSLLDMFEEILKHEVLVSQSINMVYETAFTEKDYATSQFMQWYIEEQIEEESTFKGILDKFRLAGDQKGGLFHIDKELGEMAAAGSVPPAN
ncbi:MAG: ferritin [Bacteroidales bacterium]